MRHPIHSLLVVAAAIILGATLASAEADITVEISDSLDPARPGDTVTYTVSMTNIGDDDPRPTRLNIYLPPDVPAALSAYIQEDEAAVAAVEALRDTLMASENFVADEDFGVFVGVDSLWCEGLEIQPGNFPLPPGASGEVLYSLPMPELPVRETFVHATGPGLDLDITNFGRGMCDQDLDCVNQPCMGPRLTNIDQISAAVEIIDDEYDDPAEECIGGDEGGTRHDGCTPFTLSEPGKIALIERGCCGTETKAVNAAQSGAIAAVITDYDDFTDSTKEPHHIWYVQCWDFCSAFLIPTPNVFLSLADSEQIYAALEQGEVILTMGNRETDTLTTRAHVWQSGDYISDQFADDNGNWAETTTIQSAVVIVPPEASFTFSPAAPEVDETVTFTDTSTYDPTSWAWDFGDGVGTSTEQHPTYAYAAAGSYPVTLVVGNEGGSDTATETVVVEAPPGPSLDHFYLIPAAAKAEGSEQSFFLTELAVNNAGDTQTAFQFQWLPRGTDNAVPVVSELYTLDPSTNVVFDDVLGEVFGLEDGALGAVSILADSDRLLLMSRTCNMGELGTFGQSIPGYASGELIQADERRRILFFVENDGFRSNLGLINGTSSPVRIEWERFAPDGTSLEVGFTDLPAWGNTQLNRVFAGEAPIRGGYIDVWTATEDGAFAAYGSLLDNQTSDPTTILPK